MVKPEDSLGSTTAAAGQPIQPRWMKLGLLAMTSAVLGGMATAWWYRKTLIRLRQAEDRIQNPQFGIPEDDSADEL